MFNVTLKFWNLCICQSQGKNYILCHIIIGIQVSTFFSGQSEHCKRALSLMDFDKINYNLIESTLEHILESDEYPQQGSILVFLPGKGQSFISQVLLALTLHCGTHN